MRLFLYCNNSDEKRTTASIELEASCLRNHKLNEKNSTPIYKHWQIGNKMAKTTQAYESKG